MSDTASMVMILSLKDDSQQPLIDWLAAGGWCRTVEVKREATEAQLRALRDHGFDVVMTFPAHPATRARSRMPDDVGEIIDPLIRVFDGDESQVKWQCFVEEDSAGVALSQQVLREKPATYEAAYQLREQRLDELLAVTAKYPKVQLLAVAGFATTAHAIARRPFVQVNLERTNDDIDDLQTGIAFMRGAGRQYGKRWGIDFSLWWGPIFGTVGDLPASYHRRSLYLSYFAGAKDLVLEGIGASCEEIPRKIPAVAAAAEEVGRFIQRVPAGEADVPVAVMLPEDHGWMTPPYWDTSRMRWNYAHLRARPGDRGMDGFFGQAFPGSTYTMDPFPFGRYVSDDPKATPFALSCITPEFAPSPGDVYDAYPPLPFGQFHDRDEARRWMHEHQVETADYRPMGDSRWGDVFDVLTTPADSRVLEQYPVLILLGGIVLDAELKRKLRRYVDAGGTLVCAAGVVAPDDDDLTGLRMQPRHRIGRAWRAADDKGAWIHEAMRYVPAEVIHPQRTAVDCLEAGGDPLIVRHTLGKGEVWTCLAAWFEGANADLAGPAARLFDGVISPWQPWSVQGLPIQWFSTRGADHRTLVLANHTPQPWTGSVCCLDERFTPSHAVELIADVQVGKLAARQTVDVTVAPWTVAAYRVYGA